MPQISFPSAGYAPADTLDSASAKLSEHGISSPLINPEATVAEMTDEVEIQKIALSTRMMLVGREMAHRVVMAARGDGYSEAMTRSAERFTTLIEPYNLPDDGGDVADARSPHVAAAGDLSRMNVDGINTVWMAVLDMQLQIMEGRSEGVADNQGAMDEIHFILHHINALDDAAEKIKATLCPSLVHSLFQALDEGVPE